jgi:hypothetical protein
LRDFRGPILVVYIEGGGGRGGGIWGGSGGGILGPGYILTPWPRSSWFEAVKAIINRFINNCTAGRRVAQFVHISANLLLYGSADSFSVRRGCIFCNLFLKKDLFKKKGGREFLALPH